MWRAVLSLVGIGKSYLEGRQQIKLKEVQAEADAKITGMHQASSWEQIVAQRSSRFLRWVCAGHLFAGMDFTIYLVLKGDPDPGKLFTAFELMPDWYAGLLATMFAWAFASQPVKAAGGRLVEAWGNRKHSTKKATGKD